MSVRVIISGGGTGGHIFPAISIANELKHRVNDINILFVGAKGRMEMEKVPKAGYPIKGLNISGLQRSWKDASNIWFPFKLISSLWKSYWIIKRYKPSVVVGTGGYASGPLLFVASKLSIPALIQEQNSYPGITNIMLSKSVQKICVSYDKMERFFPKTKLMMLGNPVRQDLLDSADKKKEAIKHFNLDSSLKTILVVGGSLGARTINHSIAKLVQQFEEKNIQLIWQTGLSYERDAKDLCQSLSNVQAHAFIYNMDLAYSAADIIISRAGASTISELCLIGKPALLIPSPNVAEDHQTKNAMALIEKNAALMVKDSEAQEQLGQVIFDLLENENSQKNLGDNIKKLAMPNSAKHIVDEVLKLVKEK